MKKTHNTNAKRIHVVLNYAQEEEAQDTTKMSSHSTMYNCDPLSENPLFTHIS